MRRIGGDVGNGKGSAGPSSGSIVREPLVVVGRRSGIES